MRSGAILCSVYAAILEELGKILTVLDTEVLAFTFTKCWLGTLRVPDVEVLAELITKSVTV